MFLYRLRRICVRLLDNADGNTWVEYVWNVAKHYPKKCIHSLDAYNSNRNRDKIIVFCSDLLQYCHMTNFESLLLVHPAKCQDRVWKKMVLSQLTFEKREWIIKCYWKTKNVTEIQRRWRNTFLIWCWWWIFWIVVTLSATCYNSVCICMWVMKIQSM
jgi:hypothetical protein